MDILPKEQEPRDEFSPLSVVNEASPPSAGIFVLSLGGFCTHNHNSKS